VNVEEKVATLEALLARVKNNAAKPRVQRLAAPPNGEAGLAKPAARAVELAVAALDAPPARPVEKVAPARAVAAVSPEPPDPIEAQFEKLLEAKVEKLLDVKLEKPVEAKAAKPVDADTIDVWADALAEVPRAQDKPPVAATTTAKRDEGTAKPAPIAARSVTSLPTKAVTPRPSAPVARPVATRPTTTPKVEATPSPMPTAAKPAEAAKPVEKIAPAITPPKPVEKVAPVITAPKPVEKIAPVVAPTKPVEKAAPIAAVAKPVEKVEAIKAQDESRFDLDALLDPPGKPEVKAAAKPVEAAVAATPAKVPALPPSMPPLPVEPVKAKLVEEPAGLEPHDEETRRIDSAIPDPEPPTIVEETTTDEETVVVSLAKAEELAAEESTSDKAEADEPTHIFDSRTSRPEAPLVTPEKVASESIAAFGGDDLKVVVSPAVRTPAVEAAVPAAAEKAAAIKIVEAAVPPTLPSDTNEATAPSRRYSKPADEVAEPVRPRRSRRASTLTLGLVAALLIGAGIFRGLRDGWFESSTTPIIPTTPTASALPKTAPTASAATTASAAPTTSAAAPEPTSSASAATSASAAPTTSAVPSALASAAPTAAPTTAPVADGDGTKLPATRGYIIVNSAKPGSVFLTGRFVGEANARLEVDCGAKFLRLAAPTADGAPRPATPDWTSEGRSIGVPCRTVTTITLEASR